MSKHHDFGRDNTGIHTVEGNLAGRRAAQLTKKREKDQQEYEAKKRKIQEEGQKGLSHIDDKFKSVKGSAFEVCFHIYVHVPC